MKDPKFVSVNGIKTRYFGGYELFQHIASAMSRTRLHVFNHAGHSVFRDHAPELERPVADFVKESAF